MLSRHPVNSAYAQWITADHPFHHRTVSDPVRHEVLYDTKGLSRCSCPIYRHARLEDPQWKGWKSSVGLRSRALICQPPL